MGELVSTQIALPTGSYVSNDPRSSCKRLVNVFSEQNPQDAWRGLGGDSKSQYPLPQITLRRWVGITPFANVGSNLPVRGMWEMSNVVYAVIGNSLYTLSSTGTLTQIATGIGGTGFVRMTDNYACLVILVPNSYTCYTYCPNGGGFQQLTASTFLFYGAVDCWFCDSYICFLSLDGRTFYNDDGQIVSGQNQITFNNGAVFPREYGTDAFVGFCIDHREPVFLGLRTSEGFINVGTPTGSPFSAAPDSFIQLGCHPDAAYSIALQDQAFFWVASDKTVRRRNGQTPIRVSNSGIEAILESADLTGSYALTPTIVGHPLWIYTMPAASRTLVYDCLTTQWFELESYGIGYWRPLSYIDAFGLQLVGDSLNGQIGYLDSSDFTEFGNPMVSTFITQSIYDNHNRIVHRRIELMMTAGEGTYTNSPQVTLYKSDDSGRTFIANPTRTLGYLGDYENRAYWFNLGQSRDRVYKFSIADPSPTFTVDITADLEGGKW